MVKFTKAVWVVGVFLLSTSAVYSSNKLEIALADYRLGYYGVAKQRFEELATENNAEALFWLGSICQKGLGTPHDFARAADLFQRSAWLGNGDAQNNLGLLYRDGKGRAQDLAIALAWFTVASEDRHRTAELNRSRLADRLDAEQFSRSHKLVREFKAEIRRRATSSRKLVYSEIGLTPNAAVSATVVSAEMPASEANSKRVNQMQEVEVLEFPKGQTSTLLDNSVEMAARHVTGSGSGNVVRRDLVVAPRVHGVDKRESLTDPSPAVVPLDFTADGDSELRKENSGSQVSNPTSTVETGPLQRRNVALLAPAISDTETRQTKTNARVVAEVATRNSKRQPAATAAASSSSTKERITAFEESVPQKGRFEIRANEHVYMVQLGIFRNSDNVRKIHSKLSENGERLRQEELHVRGIRMQRLRIGPYVSFAKARTKARELDTILRVKSLVVKTDRKG